eukprot:TRINITY_DN1695_c0_g1_i1.p1 TRINITY_DN1695_c0_g1~~TRINITY_DN1695_c0_g1_i1.p1  ORF type:complete len:2092 (+),score=696.54 TRINITY_DN1695_c0_g1_i1:73-6276(+)
MAWRPQGAWAQQPRPGMVPQVQVRPGGITNTAVNWAQQMRQQQQQVLAGAAAQQQQKGAALAAGKGGQAAAQGPETYVVSTSGTDGEEVVVKTLVGEYNESGNNHGRKVFKKVLETATAETVDVFMYYWDQRDGAAFEGWWFGNKVGGTQVWSHNASSGMAPPTSGWKIPWDGAVRSTLSVVNKANSAKSPAQSPAQSALKAATSDIVAVSNSAKTALEQAKLAAGDYLSMEGLKKAESLLLPQLTALGESMKKLTEAGRGSSPEALRQATQLRSALQTLMSGINVELGKVRASKGKAEQAEKNKAADDRDLAAFMEILPEATQKANAAEDAVEKAVITSEMIAAGGEDLDEIKAAVAATEQSMQEAQKAMGEARIFLNAKQASARRFESEKIKAKAATDLGQLQAQLQEAQNKLNPLKNVRQDFNQRVLAQKIVQEILEKLSPAEVDVDRAEEATAAMKAESGNQELMQQATTAVTKAGDHIAQVLRFIESKKKTAVGKAKDELMKMEDRAKSSQTRLAEMKNSQKEATERLGLESLLKDASDKLQTVAQAVAKAADAEAPWLMGVEELPLEESVAAIKGCETAATAANTAASIARMFIATKLVEAKRFTAELSTEAQGKLKTFQTELEAHTKKLTELKKNTAGRKSSMFMREAEHEVNKAEELAAQVAKAASALQDDEKLAELTSADIKAAAEETVKAEQIASKQLAETRKFLTARQIEAKGKDVGSEVSSELITYEKRLRNAQTEIAKYKKCASTVDQRLAAKKSVEDAQAKIDVVSTKLQKLKEMSEALTNPPEKTEENAEAKDGEEKASKESDEKVLQKSMRAAEQCAADAQASLKAAGRFLEMQLRTQSAAAKELEKLKPKIDELQEQLDASVASMRERSEKAVLDAIRTETEGRVKEVEESIRKLTEAEKPFLPDAEEPVAADKLSEALSALEAAVGTANSAVSGAKTLVGVKKLAARRLAEASKKQAEDQLKEVTERLEEQAKVLAETKKNMNDRKMEVVKKEVISKVEEAEKKVEEAEQATAALTNFGKPAESSEGGESDKKEGEVAAPPPADEMKAACEKAGAAQQEAKSVVTASQKLLLARQKDAKVASAGSVLVAEITTLLDRLAKLVSALDKQKVTLRDQEHRFVAQRLHKDATEKIGDLDKKLAAVTELASPLTSDEEGMYAVVFLGYTIDRLKASLKADSKTPKELFTELCAGKAGVTKDAFIQKMKALEEKAPEEMTLSEEQLNAAFKRLAGKEADEVPEQKFLNEFTTRYLCAGAVTMTDGMVIKGGKTVRKVEPNEVLEGLGEPAKEEALGLMRVQVKAEKDGKQGYVTVAGNQGSVYLEVYTPYKALQKGVDQAVKELMEASKEAIKYLDTKAEELKAVRTGPLAETKAELLKLKPQVAKVQASYTDLKKKVSQADKKLSQVMEEEKKKRIEAADKKAAAALVEEVVQAVNSAEESTSKVLTGAESLIASLGGDQDSPLAAMDTSEKDLVSAQETLETAMGKIKSKMEEMKGQPPKGPFAEAKNSLVKLKVKVGAMESKCKKLVTGLKTARSDLTRKSEGAVLKAFRTHAQEKAVKPDDLYKELASGADAIPAAALREYFDKMPDSGLKASQLDMAMGRFAAGLTKLSLLELLQEFQKCIRETSMTTSLEVKDGKTIRKLAKDELLEVLEVGKTVDATSLRRCRCRALQDGKEGWVTFQGNQGTTYLEKIGKPFYCCEADSELHSAFESSSSEVCKVKPGEVLELIEGPRKEEPPETTRLKGKATKDGKTGFVTLKDMAGNDNFTLAKLLVCKHSIAITNTFDIAAGKALRKLEVGEALEVLEGPNEDSVRSLSRVRVLAKKDGKEGWVTVQGNQGTAYAEPSDKHYVCGKAVPLESKLATGSALVRQIEVGEAFEALDAPKTEKRDAILRVRGRDPTDNREGWFTITGRNFSQWSPTYKCIQGTVLNDCLEIKEAKSVRKLEAGEVLEALHSPVLEPAAGLLRVRVRAKKDNACGWATVRGNQGTVILKPVLGSEPERAPASKEAAAEKPKSSSTSSASAPAKAAAEKPRSGSTSSVPAPAKAPVKK